MMLAQMELEPIREHLLSFKSLLRTFSTLSKAPQDHQSSTSRLNQTLQDHWSSESVLEKALLGRRLSASVMSRRTRFLLFVYLVGPISQLTLTDSD